MHRSFRKSTVAALLLAAATVVGAGCSHAKPDPMSAVMGNMSHDGFVTLSPDAVAYVRLADLSDDIVGGKTVIQTEVHPDDYGNLSYFLNYHDKAIQPNHEYAVDVRVVDKGQLMLISDTKNAVLTNGHGNMANVTLRTPGRVN